MANGSTSIAERSRTRATAEDQASLFDKVIESENLEAKLEERERLRVEAASAKGAFETARDEAKAMIEEHGLGQGEVARCGRFKISKSKPGAPSEVAFTTNPKSQLRISTLDEG